MGENLSLFGWPLPEPREVAGRPEHVVTEENRNKVMMLLAFKLKNSDIAAALGISQPTLRKHYFQELTQRRVARLQLDAQLFAALYERAVIDKDVPAIKALEKRLEKLDLAEISAAFGDKAPRAGKKLGKKEQQQEEAATAGDGSEWGDDLVPRPRLDG